jgi:hypothetical protein
MDKQKDAATSVAPIDQPSPPFPNPPTNKKKTKVTVAKRTPDPSGVFLIGARGPGWTASHHTGTRDSAVSLSTAAAGGALTLRQAIPGGRWFLVPTPAARWVRRFAHGDGEGADVVSLEVDALTRTAAASQTWWVVFFFSFFFVPPRARHACPSSPPRPRRPQGPSALCRPAGRQGRKRTLCLERQRTLLSLTHTHTPPTTHTHTHKKTSRYSGDGLKAGLGVAASSKGGRAYTLAARQKVRAGPGGVLHSVGGAYNSATGPELTAKLRPGKGILARVVAWPRQGVAALSAAASPAWLGHTGGAGGGSRRGTITLDARLPYGSDGSGKGGKPAKPDAVVGLKWKF